MNYLTLCQKLSEKVGYSNSQPATVADQYGQMAKVVGWVAEAWTEIQAMRTWRFMWNEFSFNTVADQRDYAPVADCGISDLEEWDPGSFLIYKTATGVSDQGELPYCEYRDWRRAYRAQMAARDSNRPTLFTIMPDDQSLRFESVPDAVYTIEGEYKRTHQVLAEDADEPTGLPLRFHMMIVYKAMMLYGFHEDAPEVLAEGETQWDIWLPLLENSQLPDIRIGAGALA